MKPPTDTPTPVFEPDANPFALAAVFAVAGIGWLVLIAWLVLRAT